MDEFSKLRRDFVIILTGRKPVQKLFFPLENMHMNRNALLSHRFRKIRRNLIFFLTIRRIPDCFGTANGKEIKMQVKEGQKVIYSKYAGTEVKLDGKEVIIVRQSDILAIVE